MGGFFIYSIKLFCFVNQNLMKPSLFPQNQCDVLGL